MKKNNEGKVKNSPYKIIKEDQYRSVAAINIWYWFHNMHERFWISHSLFTLVYNNLIFVMKIIKNIWI